MPWCLKNVQSMTRQLILYLKDLLLFLKDNNYKFYSTGVSTASFKSKSALVPFSGVRLYDSSFYEEDKGFIRIEFFNSSVECKNFQGTFKVFYSFTSNKFETNVSCDDLPFDIFVPALGDPSTNMGYGTRGQVELYF